VHVRAAERHHVHTLRKHLVSTTFFIVLTSIISTKPTTLVAFTNVTIKISMFSVGIKMTVEFTSALFSGDTLVSMISDHAVGTLATGYALVDAF
jgi:uncharacterized membrane protein YczE